MTMTKLTCWTLSLFLAAGGVSGQTKTADYKTMSGQLLLKTTEGGSALFKTQEGDYDVWLPRDPALSSITSGTTVSIEGVYTTDTSLGLEAPIVHPYKITVRGRVIDLSKAFGWTGQARGSGVDTVSGATGAPRSNNSFWAAGGQDDSRRSDRDRGRGRDRDDEDDDD